MDNTIFRLHLSHDYQLEFAIYETNTPGSNANQKEVGLTITGDGEQIDGDLEGCLTSLIDFLQRAKEYTDNYNNLRNKQL